MEKISNLGFLLVVLCFITRDITCKGETLRGNCLRADRKALLDFKNGLKDSSSNRLSSWIGGNCCQWEGIGCENNTGVVISIDLHNPYSPGEAYENWSLVNLGGEIRPSLIELKSLRYLDLSGNSFEHIAIPKFFGSLKNLQYLNLSNSGFRGAIPPTLGNLSNLQFLDLSSYEFQLFVKDLEWMTSLVSLRHLKMNYVNLSMVGSHWVEALNKLPFLTELHLQHCGLSSPLPFLSSINFTSLSVISISGNPFRSKFPLWLLNLSSLIYVNVSYNELYGQISPGLGKLPNLQYLDLSGNANLTGSCSQLLRGSWKKIEFLNLAYNNFLGTIPEWLSKLEKLTHLDLSHNKLEGPIPVSFGTFKNLNEMWLGSNQLNGSLPVSLGQLSELVTLDVSWNQLTGILSEEHFSKLSKLKKLWMNGNSGLILNVSSTWVPPFQITDLSMASCHLGPSFPTWPRSQKEVSLLDLSNANISGTIPEWLSQLEKLTHLDLSHNNLQGSIPASFGTLKNLNEMWLDQNELNGSLPVSFGQLSELVTLDVSWNRLTGILSEEHFSKLSKLKMLWINKNSGLALNVSSTWIPPFQITDLSMASCNLGPSFPTWLRSQKEVSLLDLSNASISGTIPEWLGQLEKLTHLDLSHNKLQGPIPPSFGTFKNLNEMWLGQNELNGSLPLSFGQLSELVKLEVAGTRLTGIVSEEHFSKLSKLKMLWIDRNSGLVLNVSSTWVPPFQITDLSIASCNMGHSFPTWIRSQKELSFLDLSNASISGSIPNWFWNMSFNLRYLSLFQNQLQGQLPNSLNFSSSNSVYIDFSSNLFEGPIPFSIKGVYLLDLSDNKFSGPIPLSRGESMLDLNYLFLSKNQITGTIPNSIGHITSLQVIDLSRNNLTGSIPYTIYKCSSLIVLDLGNNHLSGMIPKSLGQLQWLESLHLNDNKLSGGLPSSFQNLSRLELLDLSYNQLSGKIPSWIGTALINLLILNLRSNAFFGRLPSQLSNLSSLHVLDLAQNNLMGEIPVTLVKLEAMTQEYNKNVYPLHDNGSNSWYEERLVVIMKGQSLEYTRTLSLVVGIDLSDNNLSGEFPQEITKLFGLVVLNLSRNHIIGQIPKSISMLHQLLSLDLSSNKLSGTIPSSMASLTFLSYLNLSNNNFSGKIPFIGQMTTFIESAFVGNPNLCGAPLVTKCQDEDLDKKGSAIEGKNDGGYIDQWFYLSVGMGFAMGILVPYFVLATRKSWCEAYFDFVDKIVKWLLKGRATYAKYHQRR